MSEPANPPPRPVRNLEAVLLGFFIACWVVLVLSWFHFPSVAGRVAIPFYNLFSFTAALGWSAGTLYVLRGRRLTPPDRRLLRWIYYAGPQGVPYLLRALAPAFLQREAPLVPLWAFGVYTVFFLVPVVVRGTMGAGR